VTEHTYLIIALAFALAGGVLGAVTKAWAVVLVAAAVGIDLAVRIL
jgi:hypothetical protein